MDRKSSIGPEEQRRSPGRRELLLGFVGGVGFLAVEGPALGASLLLRPVASPSAASFTGPTTLTRSWAESISVVETMPATFTWSATSSSPKTGTQTMTVPPVTANNGSFTMTFPAPGWETQTVTVGDTHLFKYTPPATNSQTWSWSGNSYTLTSSRTVTKQTITELASFSHSYTTLVQDKDKDDTYGGSSVRVGAASTASGSARIESIDGPGLDLLTPSGRGTARRLSFAHGRNI